MSEGEARIIYGTPNFKMSEGELADGAFFSPIVMEGMSPKSKIYNEEFFGPVFNLFRVETEFEAMGLANNSNYGLYGAVFTNDLQKADAAAKRL